MIYRDFIVVKGVVLKPSLAMCGHNTKLGELHPNEIRLR